MASDVSIWCLYLLFFWNESDKVYLCTQTRVIRSNALSKHRSPYSLNCQKLKRATLRRYSLLPRLHFPAEVPDPPSYRRTQCQAFSLISPTFSPIPCLHFSTLKPYSAAFVFFLFQTHFFLSFYPTNTKFCCFHAAFPDPLSFSLFAFDLEWQLISAWFISVFPLKNASDLHAFCFCCLSRHVDHSTKLLTAHAHLVTCGQGFSAFSVAGSGCTTRSFNTIIFPKINQYFVCFCCLSVGGGVKKPKQQRWSQTTVCPLRQATF